MSNNKERKEVALRLRVLASHKAEDEELTLDALGLYRGENIEGFDTCCVMNLADLIEPEQEHTCMFSEYKNKGDKYPTCSECGYETDWHECTWYFDDTFKYEHNYCPNCGAKVIKTISNDTFRN